MHFLKTYNSFVTRQASKAKFNKKQLNYALARFSSSNATDYDVAVIGGGPGGYVAAIKAAQLNLKTICIEKRGTLGGTCLNVGCIPSKALLNVTHKYHDVEQNFSKMGLNVKNLSYDMVAMQKHKDKVVKGLTMGIEMLFKMNKVAYKKGAASFASHNSLEVLGNDGEKETIKAKNIVIATGSEPSPFPGGGIVADEDFVLTSTGALSLDKVPKSLIVIGAGVIGLELGSVFRRLNAKVTVVEFADRIMSSIDKEAALAMQKILMKQGVEFRLSTKVLSATKGDPGYIDVECVKSGKKSKIECNKVLLSVGRRPFVKNLNLECLGVELEKGGQIPINEHFQVKNYSNIYAIGDCTRGAMLAHKAEEEGIAVAEIIDGKRGHVNYDTIPSVVYTHPEVAGVGKTEEDLIESGIAYSKGIFHFGSNSRARVNDDADGFVKILADKETDRLLGGWIVGPQAGELIHSLVLGLEYGASSEDIARVCHAHPTLSEAVKEACLSTYNKPIHGSKK